MQHRLRKMLEAPFFGRVDFIYDGEDEPEYSISASVTLRNVRVCCL